jgi:O-antigen/teichoic acid export membrane protein
LRSFPFALNKIINDLNVRLPAIVLPAMLGLAKSGLFDAAERVRNTIAMSMQAAMLGMMPALSRNFSESGSKSGQLISYAAKYVAISMSLISTGIVVCAGWIIRLLYGDQFLDAILPLQFLAWAQAVLAVDAVLRQSMLASRNEYSAVRRSLAGLLIQAFVLIVMAKAAGLTGVAAGMLVAAIALLGVDVRFVHTRIAEIQIAKAVVAPLSAALVIGAVLLVIDPADIWTRILVASAGWALAVLALRLVPRDEALLLKQVLLTRRQTQPNKD